MKISIILFALVCVSYADIYGRLDSFEDIGYLTPKNSFVIYDNVYFRTYFDKVNDTVSHVNIKEFYATLANGTIYMFYKDGTYYPASQEVYLILGNRNNLNEITAVLNLNPTIFDVPRGDRQATAFTMRMGIDFTSSGSIEYTITSQIIIGNSKRDTTDSTTITSTSAGQRNPVSIILILVTLALYMIFCNMK